jgi:iron complex transport system substrate-binding protein
MSRHTFIAAAALIMLLACHGLKTKEVAPRQQIISLSPGVTEIIYGVGAFSSLAATCKYCDFPEEVRKLPTVGDFFNIDLEAIAAIRPSLIILIEDQSIFFKDKLEQMGLRVLVVKSRSVADIIESIRTIGLQTGHMVEGERLADEVQSRIKQRASQTASLTKPRVLCVIDHMPGTLRDIYVATAGSFLDELIAASGGNNVAPKSVLGYSKIQQEGIVDADPQVIIDIVHGSSVEQAGDPKSLWLALPQIQAVRNGRVAIVSDPTIAHPSQRIVETLDVFSRIIHPEVFGSYGQ